MVYLLITMVNGLCYSVSLNENFGMTKKRNAEISEK